MSISSWQTPSHISNTCNYYYKEFHTTGQLSSKIHKTLNEKGLRISRWRIIPSQPNQIEVWSSQQTIRLNHFLESLNCLIHFKKLATIPDISRYTDRNFPQKIINAQQTAKIFTYVQQLEYELVCTHAVWCWPVTAP